MNLRWSGRGEVPGWWGKLLGSISVLTTQSLTSGVLNVLDQVLLVFLACCQLEKGPYKRRLTQTEVERNLPEGTGPRKVRGDMSQAMHVCYIHPKLLLHPLT